MNITENTKSVFKAAVLGNIYWPAFTTIKLLYSLFFNLRKRAISSLHYKDEAETPYVFIEC